MMRVADDIIAILDRAQCTDNHLALEGAIDRAIVAPLAFLAGTSAMMMFPAGRARAGRLLDCVAHNAVPLARAVS